MSKKKTTVREAIRVVGHLLETNGTTNVFARNKRGKETDRFGAKACKFCLVGAADVVAVNVLDVSNSDYDRLEKFTVSVGKVLNRNSTSYLNLASIWDDASRAERLKIIETLKNA
jgi:hypothetical protein